MWRDKAATIALVLTFIVWLPTYLLIVRPIIISHVSKYTAGIPGLLHLAAILVVPMAVARLVRGASDSRSE
jgi:hypothetical protein